MAYRQRGFTLLEVLLSIVVIGILVAVGVPVLSRTQTKNDLDAATTILVQSLRRAEILSQSVDGDSGWGVKIQSGAIALFKGASYGVRDTTRDEVFFMPTTITATGLTEIPMAKFTGYPIATGSVVLTNTAAPLDSATVTINTRGMVNY